MKNKNLKNKGITIPLSYIALAIILLSIGAIITYFFIAQTKLTTQVATSELGKEETRLLEKISLVYWGSSGCILSNDGEISVSIKKIYVDSNIIDLASPVIINPHEKKEISIPSGQDLMIETSSGKLIKLVEKGFTITQQTTWVGSLPSEITTTSYVPTTITTTQTSVSPTTITTTRSTTQTLTTTTPTTYTTTQTITTTTPITITQTSSTTQTITSYIPTTYTTTYATTGTQTITTTIPTTITTTKSTTQTLTSYIPTTYTTTQTLTSYIPTTLTNTLTQTIATTRTVIWTTYTSSYLTTTTVPMMPTAHFRGDTWNINGLNAYKLDSSQSNIEKSNYGQTDDLAGGSFCISVWRRLAVGWYDGGLYGVWYDTKTLSGNIIARMIHPIIDFTNINPAGRADIYSGVITGYIYAPYSETYTFYITTDDGARLYVNNVKIIDSWKDQGATTYTGTITLTGGQWYPIKIEHYENTGDERLKLEWSSPSIPRQTVPSDKLKCYIDTPIEIQLASNVAKVTINYDSQEGYYSATWSHSAISLNPTDSIVIRVYGTGGKEMATFSTSQLGITQIPAGTWTVYYYLSVYNWFEGGRWHTKYYFYWGTPNKDSRIENFIPTIITTTTYLPTTVTTITDYIPSIFIGEKSPIFFITLGIVITSITFEIKKKVRK